MCQGTLTELGIFSVKMARLRVPFHALQIPATNGEADEHIMLQAHYIVEA